MLSLIIFTGLDKKVIMDYGSLLKSCFLFQQYVPDAFLQILKKFSE